LVNIYLGNVNKKKLKTHNQKLYKKEGEGKVPRVGPWYVVLASAFSLQEGLNSNILKSSMLLISYAFKKEFFF